jgi:hypothetical protein
MKKKYILLSLVALATIVFASVTMSQTRSMQHYDNSKTPKLSLPDAYQLAAIALGSATNEFHCVSAGITMDFGAPRWSFIFYSTNTPPKWKSMTVDFDGKPQEDNGSRW